MNRPSFALSILLASLAGSLLMVGTAKCQNGLNGLQIAAGHVCATSAGELYAYEEDVYGDPEAQVNSTITAEENATESNPDQCPYDPDQNDSQCPYYHGGAYHSYHSYNHYPYCPYAGSAPDYGQPAEELASDERPAADGAAYPDDDAQVDTVAEDASADLECLRSGYDAEYDRAVYGIAAADGQEASAERLADVAQPNADVSEASESASESIAQESGEEATEAYPYDYADYGYDYDYSYENDATPVADAIEPTESATESEAQESVEESIETEAAETESEAYPYNYEDYGYEYDYDYDYSYENDSAPAADAIEPMESAIESDAQESVEEATETEATESEAAESEATESEATESEATESEATESEATESEAAETEAAETEAAETDSYEYEYDYDYDYSYENDSAPAADAIEPMESATESDAQESVEEATETEATESESEAYPYNYEDYGYEYGYDYSYENDSAPAADAIEPMESATESDVQESVEEATETEVEAYQYDEYDYDDYDYGYGDDYSYDSDAQPSAAKLDDQEQAASDVAEIVTADSLSGTDESVEGDASHRDSDDSSYGYEYDEYEYDEIQFHYDGPRNEPSETNDRGWYLDDDSDRYLAEEFRSADERFESADEANGSESLDATAEPVSQPESAPAAVSDDYQGWDGDYGYSDGYDDWGYQPYDPSVAPAADPGFGGLDFDGVVRVIREAVASASSQLHSSLIDLRQEIEVAMCGTTLEQAWYDAAQESRQQEVSVEQLPENQCDLPRDEAYPWYECECWYND